MKPDKSKSSINPDEAIYSAVRRVPKGKVATYGQIAALAGLGHRARMVGRALKKLPQGTNVPWQRIVNSSGKIPGPVTRDGNEILQRVILEKEGIEFRPSGTIDLDRFRWEPGLREYKRR
jgi:methylated-DNA-protein-cysteine methyltransferase-like protein